MCVCIYVYHLRTMRGEGNLRMPSLYLLDYGTQPAALRMLEGR